MYIRTKDKIYDLSNKYSQTPEEVQIALMTGNYQQADTIEKLCDGFYATENSCWEKDYYLFGNKDFEDFKDFTKDFPNGFARGFIATNKGLIYVAKMNDKGDLELI